MFLPLFESQHVLSRFSHSPLETAELGYYQTAILRSARFLTFALGATLFSAFQQSAGVCTKQRF